MSCHIVKINDGFVDVIEIQIGVTTRKCTNCPAREAAAMLPRSAIRAGT
jgi:hypothetical protein